MVAQEDVDPPRAKDRAPAEDARLARESRERGISHGFALIARWLDGHRSRGAAVFLVSLLLPGFGQLVRGRFRLAAGAFLGTLLLIGLLWHLAFVAESQALYLVLGMFLMAVHAHCFFLLFRQGGPWEFSVGQGRGFLVGVGAVVFVQVYLFARLMGGGGDSLRIQNDTYAPFFLTGDILRFQRRLALDDLARGDLAMVEYNFIERVYGLPGDRMVVWDGILWVNDQAVTDPAMAPVSPGNRGMLFGEAAVARVKAWKGPIPAGQMVASGSIGTVRNGQGVVFPWQRRVGRIEAILWPNSRRRELR